MIISVHLPKTAGTSFGRSLKNHFGEQFFKDGSDYPFRTTAYNRNEEVMINSVGIANKDFGEIQCVHGHFLPAKYLLLDMKRELQFVTWMRDPIERLISHYFYWKRRFKVGKSELPGLGEAATLEEFCLHPKFRNLYTQYFFAFHLESFEFIGITEFYNEDYRFFSKNIWTLAFLLYLN